MELQNSFSIVLTFSFFIFMLFKIMKVLSSKYSTVNLPPGPWTLPIIGNLHQIVGSIPHQRLRKLAAKYGPLMHPKLGEVSNIIVSSPEMAAQIMKIHDLNFSDRPLFLVPRIISYNASDILFSPYGVYWRELRKICTIELLTAKRVHSFRSIREEEVSALVKTLYASRGSVVNLTEKIIYMTYGITARAAFGTKNRYQQKFISTIKEVVHLAGGTFVADLYPSITMLQLISGTKAKLEKLHKEIDKILQNIIDDHKNRDSNHCGAEDDLVDVLLKFQQKNSEYPLTDEKVKAVILDIFSGGGETSSAVVEWGMSEMMKNPKVMAKAQAEVRNVFANKGYVDETDIHQLTYLKCVIKETLRLHPSAPLLVPRESRESCKINGYEIPAKTKIIINAWAIGRDPRYWSEAESFKPERFLDSNIDFKGTDFEYIPFGAGRRMCPGIAFATANIELPLAQLLYHFDWKLPNRMKQEDLDMTESSGLTISRKNDLCLIPISRQP